MFLVAISLEQAIVGLYRDRRRSVLRRVPIQWDIVIIIITNRYCDVSAVWVRVARDRGGACEVLGAELICVETWTVWYGIVGFNVPIDTL